jgi:hypothetical protein
MANSFEKLLVYQKAVDFADSVYTATPAAPIFGCAAAKNRELRRESRG